ncbi:probable G-protein coupled receptor 162 [Ambystoma mexicanum]|uniref:probable G-protein coupled receptor 162 n=1 Tax=Ambystoma mexicanum TaxID=8296 RepID=UPI0037E9C056
MHHSPEAETLHNNSLSWLACGVISLLANGWTILSISAKQQKHKPLELLLCFLAGTHILMAAIPLTMFSVIQLRKEASEYDWNEGICKVFVSTYYTLALATCFTVASLSYHRMWMVRWPVNYRLSNTKKQALHAIMGIWMVSFILSTLPSIGWHDNTERYYARGCQFIVSKIGLGFGVCFSLLLLGGISMGLICVAITFYHALCGRGRASRRAARNAFNVPTIVVEDAQGKRRSSLDGSESAKTSMQMTNLIGAIVFLYDTLTGLPILVVSFVSLKYNSAPTWMVLCVLWCSMVQTLLLPSFIWSCERYRADVKTVWEQCVAIMSEEDGDDENGRDDYLDGRLCEVRFDANGTASMKRIPPFIGAETKEGKFLPLRPSERIHYLQVQRHQVPLSRRMSHDETDMFSNRSMPFIQKWSSSDDIRAGSPRRGPIHPPPDLLEYQRRRQKSDDGLTSLRQFLEAGMRGGNGADDAFFCREEITTFIDETPMPSPAGSPYRSRAQAASPRHERRMSLSTPEPDAARTRRCSLTEAGVGLQPYNSRKPHIYRDPGRSPDRARGDRPLPRVQPYRGRADPRDLSLKRTCRSTEAHSPSLKNFQELNL